MALQKAGVRARYEAHPGSQTRRAAARAWPPNGTQRPGRDSAADHLVEQIGSTMRAWPSSGARTGQHLAEFPQKARPARHCSSVWPPSCTAPCTTKPPPADTHRAWQAPAIFSREAEQGHRALRRRAPAPNGRRATSPRRHPAPNRPHHDSTRTPRTALTRTAQLRRQPDRHPLPPPAAPCTCLISASARSSATRSRRTDGSGGWFVNLPQPRPEETLAQCAAPPHRAVLRIRATPCPTNRARAPCWRPPDPAPVW